MYVCIHTTVTVRACSHFGKLLNNLEWVAVFLQSLFCFSFVDSVLHSWHEKYVATAGYAEEMCVSIRSSDSCGPLFHEQLSDLIDFKLSFYLQAENQSHVKYNVYLMGGWVFRIKNKNKNKIEKPDSSKNRNK